MQDRRRLALALMASSGALAGHVLGSTVIEALGAFASNPVGHAHLGPLGTIVVPFGITALCWLSVRGARSQLTAAPSWRRLAGAQILLFALLESVEIISAGLPLTTLFTQANILAGFAAQLLVAWALVSLVGVGERLVAWCDSRPRPPRIPATDEPVPALIPIRSEHSRSHRHRRGPPRAR